jgi:hypothetical protein
MHDHALLGEEVLDPGDRGRGPHPVAELGFTGEL